MHFFAQIKPKSHIHIMWTNHLRRSALLDGVMFKVNDDGVYESDELTDEQIQRFRTRDDIVKLIVSGIVPHITEERLTEIAAIPDEAIDTSDIPELVMPPKRSRPKLKE